jgi:MoaA/NifB/PqqE/SkfB family radical SAM enzyme
MNISMIRRCCRNLAKFGVGYVFLQGGEPLIRQDIFDIVDSFILSGIKPTIITNGLLLTEEVGEKIAKRHCNLAVSIDSLDSEVYKKIRGVEGLKVVMQNITSLSNKKHKGNWALTSTITRLTTLQDIKLIEEFALTNGFMYGIRPYVFVNGAAGKLDNDLVYNYEDVNEIFEYMLAKSRSQNYLASLAYEEHIKYLKGNKMVLCDADTYSFVLKENGLLCPCLELPNLTFTLDKFKQAREKHAQDIKECNKCNPCFYNCAREVGILWRNKWRILFNFPRIAYQLMQYGNFF